MDIGKFRQKNPNPSIIWLNLSHLQGGQSSDTSAGPRWPHILSGKFLDEFFVLLIYDDLWDLEVREKVRDFRALHQQVGTFQALKPGTNKLHRIRCSSVSYRKGWSKWFPAHRLMKHDPKPWWFITEHPIDQPRLIFCNFFPSASRSPPRHRRSLRHRSETNRYLSAPKNDW